MANTNHFLGVVVSVACVLVVTLFNGFFTIAIGEFFLAIREMALNTRPNSYLPRGEYEILGFVSWFIAASGWLTVAIGVTIALWMFIEGKNNGESMEYLNRFLGQHLPREY